MYVDYFFFSYSRSDSFFRIKMLKFQMYKNPVMMWRESMVMYIDLIMIENFVMNYIILYTTGKILNKKRYSI